MISPLLANIYLDELDHLIAAQGLAMTRYADDFVIQTRSQAQADQALELVRQWVEKRGLKLHPAKTRITHAEVKGQGFEFLGYYFERQVCRPRQKSKKKFREMIRQQTPKRHGQSLASDIQRLNVRLREWFEYFKTQSST